MVRRTALWSHIKVQHTSIGRLLFLAFALSSFIFSSKANAQYWSQIGQFPGTAMGCAFFFNANEGLIGTGAYQAGLKADIYRTIDGGKTWKKSLLPNPLLFGQVTDIYFRNRASGWATIKQAVAGGWSGLYHSTDEGVSWRFVTAIDFPTAVRETKRGLFVADRTTGLYFSPDGGQTIQLAANFSGALGLDFLDDANGYLTTEARVDAPHLVTVDSGKTWSANPNSYEAWTVFGDPATSNFYYSSEHDNVIPPSRSFIIQHVTPVDKELWPRGQNGLFLTGGINGWKGCKSVLYAQAYSDPKNPILSFLRSTDAGVNWIQVGGPRNKSDCRFAVTGRGAVVFATDRNGNLFKTIDGGDGSLTPSILSAAKITTGIPQFSAALCDSTTIEFLLNANTCDDIVVSSTVPEFDPFNELQFLTSVQDTFGKTGTGTIVFRYHAHVEGPHIDSVRFTLRQQDGYEEDTVIALHLLGLPAATGRIHVLEAANDTLNFGAENICTGDSLREITIENESCADADIISLSTEPPFYLRSNFKPFVLSGGTRRPFLVQFKPSIAGVYVGKIYIRSRKGLDSVALTGSGIPGERALSVIAPKFITTTCDTATGEILIRNLSCDTMMLSTLTVTPPFSISISGTYIVAVDSGIVIPLRYFSAIAQSVSGTLHILGSHGFDTTIRLSAITTAGTATLTQSVNSIDFGILNLCESLSDTIIFGSIGCGSSQIHVALRSTSNDVRIFARDTTLKSGEYDTVVVSYQPQQKGTATGTIEVTSNGGNKTIAFQGSASSSASPLRVRAPGTLQINECADSLFGISVTNTTCGPFVLDSITFGGMTVDLVLPHLVHDTIPLHGQMVIPIMVTPSDSGLRFYTIRLHGSAQGIPFDTTITISAQAFRPQPVRFSIGNAHRSNDGSSTILIPLYAIDSSILPITSLDFSLALNTDLLTPLNTTSIAGSIAAIPPDQFQVSKNMLHVHWTLPKNYHLLPGLLYTIEARPYLTDTTNTSVVLSSAKIGGEILNVDCYQALALSVDSIFDYTRMPSCGNRLIANVLGRKTIDIRSIVPNPSNGRIIITVDRKKDFTNEAIIDIVDQLGEQIMSVPVPVMPDETTISIPVDLPASGAYYIRLSSGNIVQTKRIVIER